jgi:hypothetical protein
VDKFPEFFLKNWEDSGRVGINFANIFFGILIALYKNEPASPTFKRTGSVKIL